MDGWLWGTWRALVGEWEVAVAHEGHVVVLMVWQERRRMMVVLIMEGRSRQRRGGVGSRQGVTVQIRL